MMYLLLHWEDDSSPYGLGDGSSTFNVPDLRGRVVAGLDNMGGSSAELTNQSGGVNGDDLNAKGGSERHDINNSRDAFPQSHGYGT